MVHTLKESCTDFNHAATFGLSTCFFKTADTMMDTVPKILWNMKR